MTEATEEQVLEALGKVPIFASLDDRNRRKLAKLCALKSFDKDSVLFEEGTMGLSLFIVISGKVDLSKKSGSKTVGLGRVENGGLLGQLALLDDQPRAATATAVEATECLLLTRDSFDTLVKKDPAIAWCLTPALAERVRDLQTLAVEAERAKTQSADEKTAEPPSAATESAEAAAEGEEDDGEPSELESALFKLMRLQYGMIAGTAKGVTEVARVMEGFIDSMATETDVKSNEDWRDLLERMPDAMVTATRNAMDKGGKVPEEVLDAYRRYSDDKN